MSNEKLVMKIIKWSAGIGLLVLIVAFLAGVFTQKIQPGEEPEIPAAEAPTFSGEAVAAKFIEPMVEKVPGTLSATLDSTISSRIMAGISEITVRSGDPVSRGQTLVRLDARDLSSRQAQALQTVAAAQARLTDAEKEYNRIKKLMEGGIVPSSMFDSAEAGYKATKADLARAQESVTEASTGRSFATIDAPFSGRVVDRYAEPGDTAMPGQTILRIYDPGRMRLEANVRESLAATLGPGLTLKIFIDAIKTEVDGRIEEIVPQSEPGSRSVLVKVSLPERRDLYPGMFGRLLIPAGQAERLYIPAASVHRVGQLTFVWVKGGRTGPLRRFITLGEHLREGQTEVLSGLKEGERVGLP
jgi:RND family efflux transporter MFP subunit